MNPSASKLVIDPLRPPADVHDAGGALRRQLAAGAGIPGQYLVAGPGGASCASATQALVSAFKNDQRFIVQRTYGHH